jgi:hypothetical protein
LSIRRRVTVRERGNWGGEEEEEKKKKKKKKTAF